MDRLDAVAMVDVEVDVQDPQAGPSGGRDGQARVVVDAEPGGPSGHRVVEATAGVEGMLDVTPQDRAHRPERPAGHGGRRVVHPSEWRHVAARRDPETRGKARVGTEPADRGEVGAGVDGQEVLVRDWFGGQTGLGADRTQKVDRGPEPARCQGMGGAEVVGR